MEPAEPARPPRRCGVHRAARALRAHRPKVRLGETLVGPLYPAVDAVKGPVEHVLVPGAVPRLDIGLDPGEEVSARPLFRGQALGAEPAYLAIEGVDVDRLWPVVLDHDPAANDDCRDIGAHRAFDKGLGNVEIRVDPRVARHPVEIDEDRVAL